MRIQRTQRGDTDAVVVADSGGGGGSDSATGGGGDPNSGLWLWLWLWLWLYLETAVLNDTILVAGWGRLGRWKLSMEAPMGAAAVHARRLMAFRTPFLL